MSLADEFMADAGVKPPSAPGTAQPGGDDAYRDADGVLHLTVRGLPGGAPAPAPSLADQFTADAKGGAAIAPQDQQETGFLGGVGNALYGTAKGLADLPYGASQLAMHAAAHLPGAAGQYMAEKSGDYDAFLKQGEDEYQRATKGSIAAGAGRFAGNVAMPLPGAGAVKGAVMTAENAPKLAIAATNLAKGIGTGSVIGALQPIYNDGGDYSHEKASQAILGGALGAAAPAIVKGTMAGYDALKPIVSPSRAAADQLAEFISKAAPQTPEALSANVWSGPGAATGANAAIANPNVGALVPNLADTLRRVQGAPSFVEGSKPTTAQVAGIPELVMAEKVLRNNPAYAGQFMDRANANNQARMSAVSGVAQTPEALAMAKALRSSTADPLYDAFKAKTFDISDGLQGLLDTPIGQAAVKRAKNQAENEQRPFNLTQAIPEVPPGVSTPVSTPYGWPKQPDVPGAPRQAAQPAQMDGYAANLIKMAIDAMAKEKKAYGIGAHEAGTLGDISASLVRHMDAAAPEFGAARAAYASGSVPVNTMEVGQHLLDALSSGTMNSAGDAAPALSIYRNKLAQALKESKYGIDPQAQSVLDGVQNDLQRETISNSVRSGGGSDTAYNLQAPNWLASKLYGEGYSGKSPLAQALGGIGGFVTGGPVGAAGGVVAANKLGQFVGGRVNEHLARALLDPEYFAQILSRKLGSKSADDAINSAFQRAQGAANAAPNSP